MAESDTRWSLHINSCGLGSRGINIKVNYMQMCVSSSEPLTSNISFYRDSSFLRTMGLMQTLLGPHSDLDIVITII